MQKDSNSISEDPTLLTDTYSYFTSLLSNKKPDTSLIQTKTSLLKKLQKLEALVANCQNINAIQTANRHIQAAISVITVINQQSTEKKLPVKQKVSPNQNCEHQHFFSTKKRRYSSTPTLSRPTVKEIKIEKDLESADVKFCGSCLKDDKTTVDIVEWIQCDIRTVWLHFYSTQPQLTTIPANYVCHFCNIKETQ